MAPVLTTARLSLRPLEEVDIAQVDALLADPAVYRFLCDGAPAPPALVRALVAQSVEDFQREGVGQFLVRLRDGGECVGVTGFRQAEVGGFELICALWPRFWGQGLAQEAARACLDFAFEQAGLAEVVAGADAPNASSLALIARLGFRPLRETPGAFGAIQWFVRQRPGAG